MYNDIEMNQMSHVIYDFRMGKIDVFEAQNKIFDLRDKLIKRKPDQKTEISEFVSSEFLANIC
ncbi:hypothetical protein FAI41_05785 [Acetobacteraceae bacterium]|nr:hypothetical protein FAI41_05785 [Acetobacteraceae bacterium]